jgi:GAG-pre-integrase domain
VVVCGTKVENNLYRLNVITSQPNKVLSERVKLVPQTLFIHEPAQSWEIWHKRFGHVSYPGLQKLLDHNALMSILNLPNLIVLPVPNQNNLLNLLVHHWISKQYQVN